MEKNQKLVCEELLENMDKIGDVTFLVGPHEEQVKCFIFLLRSLSLVFNTMFDENWKSQDQELVVKLSDMDPKMFSVFLKLLMMDNLKSSVLDEMKLSVDEVFGLRQIGNKYHVNSICSICIIWITIQLKITNVVSTYQKVQKLDDPELEMEVFEFIKRNIGPLTRDDSFPNLSTNNLNKILNCEEMDVDELDLFNGVYRWGAVRCRQNNLMITGVNIRNILGDLSFLIRFPLMNIRSLCNIRLKRFLTSEELSAIHRCIVDPSQLDVNVSGFKTTKRKRCKEDFHHYFMRKIQPQKKLHLNISENLERLGDVTFLVGPNEEQVKCFIFILRTLSPVFNIMFDEKWKSKDQHQIVKLPDCDAQMFCVFLKLLVMDSLNREILNNLEITMDQIFHLLYIANKYDVSKIQVICRTSIQKNMAVDTVALIYEMLQTTNEPEMEEMALIYIASALDQVMNHESFSDLSIGSLTKILRRDKLLVDEVLLFEAVYRWAVFQCGQTKSEVTVKDVRNTMDHLLFLIRFPVMSRKDFFERVVSTEILSEEEVFGILQHLEPKDKEEPPAFKTPFVTRKRQMAVKFWCEPFLEISGFTRDDVSEVVLHSPFAALDEKDPSKNLIELSVTRNDGTEVVPPISPRESRVDAYQITNIFKWSEPFDLKHYHTVSFRTPVLGPKEMKNYKHLVYFVPQMMKPEFSMVVSITNHQS